MKKLFALSTLGLLLLSTSSWSMMRAALHQGGDDAVLQAVLAASAAEYAARQAEQAEDEAILRAFLDMNAAPQAAAPAPGQNDNDGDMAIRLQLEEMAAQAAVQNDDDDGDAGLYDHAHPEQPQSDQEFALQLYCQLNAADAQLERQQQEFPELGAILEAARHVGGRGHAEQPGEDLLFAELLFAELNPVNAQRARNAGRPLPQPPVRPAPQAAVPDAGAAVVVAAPIAPPPPPPAVLRAPRAADAAPAARQAAPNAQALLAGLQAGFNALQPAENRELEEGPVDAREELNAAIRNAANILRNAEEAQAQREEDGIIQQAPVPQGRDAHLAAIRAGLALRRAADRVLGDRQQVEDAGVDAEGMMNALARALNARRGALAERKPQAQNHNNDDDAWSDED